MLHWLRPKLLRMLYFVRILVTYFLQRGTRFYEHTRVLCKKFILKLREDLFFRILILSCSAHLVLLVFIFFVQAGWSSTAIQVRGLSNTPAVVKILPLGASRPAGRSVAKLARGNKRKSKHKKNIKYKQGIKEKKEKTKQATGLEKELSKKSVASKKQEKIQEKLRKEERDHKERELQKAQELAVQVEQEKLERAQKLAKVHENAHDSHENKDAQECKNTHDSTGAQDLGLVEISGTDFVREEGVVYLTQKEFDAYQVQVDIQKAVQAVWEPPLGISDECSSEVELTIGWHGELLDVMYRKPTHIIVYDM